ncbi:MAG: beta-N-acetylhexosaminidase [Paracoccaceae bacterium]
MAGQGAFILGCAGPVLGADEAAFFAQAQPWGFILFARNVENPDQLRGLCAALRAAVGRDAPILIDQEGGRVQRLRAPHWREFLPPLDQVTRVGPAQAARSMWLRGALIGAEMAALGIDVNCAPTADIASDQTHAFLHNRCYGTTPDGVIAMARAMADGMAASGVQSVLKHIPGHGRATADSHFDLPRVDADLAALRATDFAPFAALADLPMAMTAHIVYDALDPAQCATQSPRVIDLIRGEIGFAGLLMSDDIAMQALSGDIGARGRASVAAGCDLVLHCNGDMAEMVQVADACGPMGAMAQARADAVIAARPKGQPLDITALAAEFDAMLGA